MALAHTQNDSLMQCAMDFLFNSLHVLYSDDLALNIARRIHFAADPVNFWSLMKKLIDLHYHKMSENILVIFAS